MKSECVRRERQSSRTQATRSTMCMGSIAGRIHRRMKNMPRRMHQRNTVVTLTFVPFSSIASRSSSYVASPSVSTLHSFKSAIWHRESWATGRK